MVAVRKRHAAETAGEAAAFLDVSQSARGYVWRERLPRDAQNLALAISQQHGLPELLGRVLAARGVALGDVPVFLDPSVKALMPDPASLAGMDRVAERIADAIVRREPVAIFGDYDVDGACSSALMARFLMAHDTPSRIYIPDRIFEGYGPNIAALETLVKEGAKLIVTVDCGTTSFETHGGGQEARHRHSCHRSPSGGRDASRGAGLVNPNRQDDVSGQGHLCAAGVVFLVLVAVMRVLRQRGHYANGAVPPDLLADLDLVALATVADVVPLTGLNRAYVRKGLAVMKSRENVGLRALFDAAGLNQAPTTYHLGYILGPRINAGGRIGDAALGARLLTTEDETEAQKIAVLLDKLNKERKAIETQMLEEAFADADRRVSETPDLPSSWSGRRPGTRASWGLWRAALWNGSAGRVVSSHGRSRRDRARRLEPGPCAPSRGWTSARPFGVRCLRDCCRRAADTRWLRV